MTGDMCLLVAARIDLSNLYFTLFFPVFYLFSLVL